MMCHIAAFIATNIQLRADTRPNVTDQITTYEPDTVISSIYSH